MMVIQVDANYDFDRSRVFDNDAIQFTDLSTGNPTSWNWTFEGGTPSTSTEPNPKITYQTPGEYAVRLVVSNGDTESSRAEVGQITVMDSSKPPYEGTVWIEPGMFLATDPSIFQSLSANGTDLRTVYDRRTEEWVEINASIFVASYEGGQTIDMQVNPEFGASQAREYAEVYAKITGQIPQFLRQAVKSVTIHGGNTNFGGGGDGDIQVYTEGGDQFIKDGFIEEIMFHEAGHVALQFWLDEEAYIAARLKDPTFISTGVPHYSGH